MAVGLEQGAAQEAVRGGGPGGGAQGQEGARRGRLMTGSVLETR